MTDNIFLPEILEKENCRIVINKDFLELTRITEVEGAEFSASETRYHNSIENVRIEDFDFLWLNSWLWEEVEQRGDYEVVINRKHNEIVLGKVKERIQYEYDGDLKEAVTWEHKYLPFYPYLSTQDLLDQFDEFWELEPYVMSARAVLTGDYEIAGQVLEDRLDLGEGYENLFNGLGEMSANVYVFDKIEKTIEITSNYIWQGTPLLTKKLEGNGFLYIKMNFLTDNIDIVAEFRVLGKYYDIEVVKNLEKKYIIAKCKYDTGISADSRLFQMRFSRTNGEFVKIKAVLFDSYVDFDLEDIAFIKNSRPDSKLALPQLSSLGAITSTEMHGNHLVAQHENGTAIIKDAKINSNAPLSSLHWGIQAYKDENGNKRLFVSTADGTYPVGWENIKYDDESVNTIFYDVARNSSSNNIAGLITEDEDGKLKVYIGEGYENMLNPRNELAYRNFRPIGTGQTVTIDKTFTEFTFYSSSTDSNVSNNSLFNNLSPITSDEQHVLTYTLLEAEDLDLSKIRYIVSGVEKKITKIGDSVSFIVSKANTGIYVSLSQVGTIKLKIQITKTSTPKPFTEGIVPNGALKVACDWSIENGYTYMIKNFAFYGPVAGGDFGKYFLRDNTRTYQYNFFKSSTEVHVGISESLSRMCELYDVETCKKTNQSPSVSTNTFSGVLLSPIIDYRRGVETISSILIYKSGFGTSIFETELAKDIYLPTYHHQPNSVINTYGISGMSDMFLYSPALTDDEIKEELEKNIDLKAIGDITIGLETIKGALVYDGDVVEEDIKKDINPKPYHWQDNSIINKYKVKGMQGIHLYKPSLSEIEILDECSRELEIINRGENGELFPNNLGEIIEI